MHPVPAAHGELVISVPKKPADAARSVRAPYTMYDQALLAAKNAKMQVRFDMATETSFTEEDCSVIGHVLTVDRFQIEIQIVGGLKAGRKVWLAKPLIAGTEVLR